MDASEINDTLVQELSQSCLRAGPDCDKQECGVQQNHGAEVPSISQLTSCPVDQNSTEILNANDSITSLLDFAEDFTGRGMSSPIKNHGSFSKINIFSDLLDDALEIRPESFPKGGADDGGRFAVESGWSQEGELNSVLDATPGEFELNVFEVTGASEISNTSSVISEKSKFVAPEFRSQANSEQMIGSASDRLLLIDESTRSLSKLLSGDAPNKIGENSHAVATNFTQTTSDRSS